MKRWLLPSVIGLFIISSATFVVLLVASTTEISDVEEMPVEGVNTAKQELEEKPVSIVKVNPEKVEKIPEVKP
ncbi:hypothetical protein HY792_03525, partial [Candidatus Desantisbacteria bacterium]|nr:hypothetical protein [Candidatus Desantisbacteria bacterium]